MKLSVLTNPPLALGAQQGWLTGSSGGQTFTGVTYQAQMYVDTVNSVHIATDQPITVSAGGGLNPQIVASWWDPFARPRRIEGLNGTTLKLTLSTNGSVCVWGSSGIRATPTIISPP